MNSPKLKELEGQIADRQKKLADIFAEAGADLDMTKVKSLGDSADVVAHIRTLNDELGDLGKKASDLRDTIAIAGEVKAREDARGQVEDTDEQPDRRSAKSVGELISKSGTFEAKNHKEFELADVDLKTLLTTSAGFAPQAVRTDRVVDYATRPIELLDFIPTVTTTQSAIVYMEETTFTNAAAETSEGSTKPEATLAYTERTSPVRKIAVTMHVTDEQLDDIAGMEQRLNNRLPFMVRQRLAGQIVSGDGSAPNLRGILNTSGIQTQAKGSDPVPDAIYKGIVLVRVTGEAEPDAYVTHPTDWQDVRLLRTADGIYIWGSPGSPDPDMIWGLRVLLVQASTLNTGVVGAWKQFSELDVRKGLTVETGYVNDDFSKNLQTLRAEMRAAIVFYRPSAFCQITGI